MKTTAKERRLWRGAIVQARREHVLLRVSPDSLEEILDDADRCEELEAGIRELCREHLGESSIARHIP